MIPAAVGSQTNGSVIRPAAFCGVVGFKPTHGLIPRTGILQLSRALDTMGTFTRSVEDAALVAECMIGFDAGDPDTRPQARPPLAATALHEPPSPPRLALVKTPVWDKAEPATRAAFEELAKRLGIETVELPPDFGRAHDWQRILCDVEMAAGLAADYEKSRTKMSAGLVKTIERGQQALAVDYKRALAGRPALNAQLEPIFAKFDALLTPATPGVAPVGLETTGNPIFNTIWTFLGTPAITLPLLKGEAAMPLGVQLVGARGQDAQLLRTANWLTARLS
jgi:Asp-tRNA(Asn)/Glu-tRNA(Gln) amidotransferase A subunit family amidase